MADEKNKNSAGEGTPESKEPEVKDGKIVIDADVFNSYKTDMHKYKEERNQLRDQVAGLQKKFDEIATKEKKAQEESLKEQQKFKELAELKEKENADLKIMFNAQKIEAALKTKALQMGINDPNDIKLVDSGKVVLNDAGEVQGVDECLTALQKSKPYLFGNATPKVDTGKAGPIPDNISFRDLMKNPTLAQKMKAEKPELYESLRQKHFAGG